MQETQEVELLCCPFCGADGVIDASHGGFTGIKTKSPRYYVIDCIDKCNRFVPNKEDAIKAWNKRYMPADCYVVRIPKEIIEEMNEPIED